MAHTYVVSSATYIPGSALDPQVTIIGTVDGIDVTVLLWLSAIQQANAIGGITAVKNLIAPIMLSQANLVSPPPPQAPAQLPTGTFVQ
jgi:hypothetical protein